MVNTSEAKTKPLKNQRIQLIKTALMPFEFVRKKKGSD